MSDPQPTITRKSVGLRSERGPVLLSCMLSTGLVAIDSTILATAVPSIVADLGGFTQFPWLFSIYLLAQAVTVPIYGKLADVIGRKPVMLAGVTLFVIGSLLCGLAWSMWSLILFRAVQGLGAGAVQPMSMTIVGDIYTLQERAKVQGYMASVWALSAVIGPTLGGVFSEFASWRWIFFVNLPLGLAALWMLKRHFKERVVRRRTSIDWAGAGLLSVGGVTLLLALLEGGQRWAWGSAASLGLFAVALVCLAGFVYAETRAADPVLPLWVFGRRTLNAGNLGSLVAGCMMMGLASYVPLFGEKVLGHGAVVSGLTLAAMSLGWPLAASQSGRLYLGLGFRFTCGLGAVLAVLGASGLVLVDAGTPIVLLALPCFVIGLGFGLVVSPGVIAAQSSVGWEHRGVATGANMFARSVGSAVGVAFFGAVANAVLAGRLVGEVPEIETLSAEVIEPAIHAVFVLAAAVSVLLLVAAALMPGRITESAEPAESAESAGPAAPSQP
ncbi:MDR family MFS transporter [Nocardioides insulae]|uniref:MDR family MFS transporter n=1 Tax=Nocardioides insulae TaxID=394734 RepID=UPI0004222ACB|nr:MDR family MFS transporter [Nocardioides insulae]